MNSQPLVSIIIPTYNREDLILETLESVRRQTYENWECIIVDDGSTDDTMDIVLNYIKKDSRFQVHKRPDFHKPGGNGARNYGFLLSKGEYINFLDSDDLISANKISEQILNLGQDDNTIAICRWKKFVTDVNEDDVIRDYTFYRDYEDSNLIFEDFGVSKSFLVAHCYLVSRAILIKSGLWNEFLNVNQDGEFFTRVILNSKKISFCENTIVYYRATPNSKSKGNSEYKVLHRIISWKLIENYIELAGLHNSSYLNYGKEVLFHSINKKYKNILYSNSSFFYKQIKERQVNRFRAGFIKQTIINSLFNIKNRSK
ncbi:glycosyltransferase [Flavobacterium agricola]|uniref:Glycosyltransferase n=1 Tax=Flavobacterium agricola TaxID=2870839 RepID=A0ABY6LW07_9FLAO|nr:glycosyltransferase family 2 protein [Flavobacterium agricola]UYW00515.1 glycosyltransferase [Flavobacterium agricola]